MVGMTTKMANDERVSPQKTMVSEWSVHFPSGDLPRYKKVVTRSRGRPTGKYPSWKNGRLMQWESHHEANAFRLLDCDPAVISFSEQPCLVKYVLNGVTHNHVPDILVFYRGRKELWEIKSDQDTTRPDIKTRTLCLQRGLPLLGYDYRVVSASELAAEPMTSTRISILRFGRDLISEFEIEAIRRELLKSGHLTWGNACSGNYGARGRTVISRLLLEGRLALDWSEVLTADTMFTPVGGRL